MAKSSSPHLSPTPGQNLRWAPLATHPQTQGAWEVHFYHSLCPVLLPLPALHRCPSLTNVLLTKLQLSACFQRALSATEGESLQ